MKQVISISLFITLIMTAFSGLFSHSAQAAPAGTKLFPTYDTHSDDSVVRNRVSYDQIGNYIVSSQSSKTVTINIPANPGKKIKSLIWYDRNGQPIRNASGSENWAGKLSYSGTDTLSGIKLSAKAAGGSPAGGVNYWDRSTGTNEWRASYTGGTYTSSLSCPSAPPDTWGYKAYPNCTDNQMSALLVKKEPYIIQDSTISELYEGRIEDKSVNLSSIKPVDIDERLDTSVKNSIHGGDGFPDPSTKYLGSYELPSSKDQITIRFQQTSGSNSLALGYYQDWASASARQMWYYYAFSFNLEAETYLYKDKELYVEWVNADVVVAPPVEPEPEPNPDPNLPPIAVISAPNEVRQGDEFSPNGYGSSDPDGTIVNYYWETSGANGTITGGHGPIWYSTTGIKSIVLAVEDNDGAFAGTNKSIQVIEPFVYARINVGGTQKENRKVILTNSSDTPKHYPITSAQWTIQGVGGASNGDIRYTGTLSDMNKIDALFKKSGRYEVTLTVRNSAGYSDVATATLNIAPDALPVAQFSMPTWIYRDPADGNRGLMEITTMIESLDSDTISSEKIQFYYNSNNDYTTNSIVVNPDDPEPGLKAKSRYARFTDNTPIEIDLMSISIGQSKSYTVSGITILVTKKNANVIQIRSIHVGRYMVDMQVKETYGQPTISEFIVDADYRTNSTIAKPLEEKVITIGNRAPTVNFIP